MSNKSSNLVTLDGKFQPLRMTTGIKMSKTFLALLESWSGSRQIIEPNFELWPV